ncbi:MAG: AtpZ/AtpI family protein [Balneolaceae bacterium]
MPNSLLPKKYAEYLGLGVEIAASISVPVFGGYFADVYFNTFPWLTLAGIALGVVLFIFTIIRITNKLNSKDDS